MELYGGQRTTSLSNCLVTCLVLTTIVSAIQAFIPRYVSVEEVDKVEERECMGTANGFSTSESTALNYNRLRQRYQGCTYVMGNLEITHLGEPGIDYDLSFLKNIRYVSGYVLIALLGLVKEIPLTSLEIIRGNYTFNLHDKELSLIVTVTSRNVDQTGGLKILKMPKLKEITNGDVTFIENPALGYIDTIDWNRILKGRTNAVHYGIKPFDSSASNKTEEDFCNGGGRWGNDLSLCQEIFPSPECDDKCGTLCYGTSPAECCHDTCAIGCDGPNPEDCSHCKDFQIGSTCVSYCPDFEYYPLMQDCIPRESQQGFL